MALNIVVDLCHPAINCNGTRHIKDVSLLHISRGELGKPGRDNNLCLSYIMMVA